MTEPNFSAKALVEFAEMLETRGLAKPNTARGYKVAVVKILDGLAPPEAEDVRSVDVPRAVRRFNNMHPGELSPLSLREYQRRVQSLIAEFVKYHADPTTYTGISRDVGGEGKLTVKRRRVRLKTPGAPGPGVVVEIPERVDAPRLAAISLDFPLRPDFLAQVVIPRDLKADEARRLCAFVMTLAADYEPKNVV